MRESMWVKVTQSCLTLCDPWTVASQALLSLEFSRKEYWSGLPYPLPGDLLNPGIESRSPALQADSLPPEPPMNRLESNLLKDWTSRCWGWDQNSGLIFLLYARLSWKWWIWAPQCPASLEFKNISNLMHLMGFPGVSDGKESACNAGDPGLIPPGWEDLLEKGMATHSSILSWRIPWTEESGQLWSVGSQRVGHNWSDLAHSTLR